MDLIVLALLVLVAVALVSCMHAAQAPGRQSRGSAKPRILIIVSSQDRFRLREDKTYSTGYFLNELVVPVRKLVDQGYEVVFANPAGNAPAMDPHSDSAEYFAQDRELYKSYREFHDGLTGLQKPRKLADVIREGLDRYAAIFFPGGHAPVEDLTQDPDVAKVLQHFHQSGKPTAAICHGPLALLSTLPNPRAFLRGLETGGLQDASKFAAGWPYAGYRLTVFSTAEENYVEKAPLDGKVRFYPDDALRAAGANVLVAQPWTAHVVRDRELITGQQPNSDSEFAAELVKAIQESAGHQVAQVAAR